MTTATAPRAAAPAAAGAKTTPPGRIGTGRMAGLAPRSTGAAGPARPRGHRDRRPLHPARPGPARPVPPRAHVRGLDRGAPRADPAHAARHRRRRRPRGRRRDDAGAHPQPAGRPRPARRQRRRRRGRRGRDGPVRPAELPLLRLVRPGGRRRRGPGGADPRRRRPGLGDPRAPRAGRNRRHRRADRLRQRPDPARPADPQPVPVLAGRHAGRLSTPRCSARCCRSWRPAQRSPCCSAVR